MKTIFVTLVLAGIVICVKAQQVPALPKQQIPLQFRVLPDSLNRNNYVFQKLDSVFKADPGSFNKGLTDVRTVNMPVAVMQGDSKMPVVKTDATTYNMPNAFFDPKKNPVNKQSENNTRK